MSSPMKFTGTIMRNGRAVAKGRTVTIRSTGRRWSGEIHCDRASTIFPGGYELSLNDGRKGKITISSIDEETAYFEGDGELK